MKKNTRAMLGLLPFFLLGCGLLCFGSYWTVFGGRSKSWERVNGTLFWEEETNLRIKGQSVLGVSVSYTYEYHGKSYQGKRLSFGGSGNSGLREIQYAPGGSNVLVWIDPKKPGRSVLVPGIMSGAIIFITLGGLVTGIIVLTICSTFLRETATPISTES